MFDTRLWRINTTTRGPLTQNHSCPNWSWACLEESYRSHQVNDDETKSPKEEVRAQVHLSNHMTLNLYPLTAYKGGGAFDEEVWELKWGQVRAGNRSKNKPLGSLWIWVFSKALKLCFCNFPAWSLWFHMSRPWGCSTGCKRRTSREPKLHMWDHIINLKNHRVEGDERNPAPLRCILNYSGINTGNLLLHLAAGAGFLASTVTL